MIQAAGYHDQNGGDHQPTDFATSGRLAISYDMFKKIGNQCGLQSTDWVGGAAAGDQGARGKGGWSVFHTWFTGGFILNCGQRAVSRPRAAGCSAGTKSHDRAIDAEWLEREGRRCTQEDRRGDPAEKLRSGPTVTLGQFRFLQRIARAWQGSWNSPGPIWNVKRA